MNTYAHSPISGSTMSHTSHHFSRTFMMRRGYARAATVRAKRRHPDDRLWTLDNGLAMLHLFHAASNQVNEHILEGRFALRQGDQSNLPRLEHADHRAEHALLLQDQLNGRTAIPQVVGGFA